MEWQRRCAASACLLARGVAGGPGLAGEVAGVLRARDAAWPWGRLAAAAAAAAGAGVAGLAKLAIMLAGAGRLPEPGLQGAQLRIVRVLAQPVGLLCGQAQRVVGLGRIAGQELDLGQQPERERAEL